MKIVWEQGTSSPTRTAQYKVWVDEDQSAMREVMAMHARHAAELYAQEEGFGDGEACVWTLRRGENEAEEMVVTTRTHHSHYATEVGSPTWELEEERDED